MPILDLFSIARSLKSGMSAYNAGQKEQADRYWSEIENSLKVAGSAQNLKFAAEEHPLRMAANQASLRATNQSTGFAAQEQPYRVQNLQQGVEVGQMNIDEARRKQAEAQRLLTDEEKAMYKPILPAQYQGVLSGPITKADLDTIIGFAKKGLDLQGIQATTQYKQEQVTGEQLKNKNAQDLLNAYAGAGTTPGQVGVSEALAKRDKAVADAQKAKIDADNEEAYKKAQIANLLEEKGASGGLKQSSAFTMVTGIGKQMDTLQNRNAIIERAIASITNGNPWEAILQNLTNSGNADANYVGGAVANSTTSDEAITNLRALQQVNNASIAQWGTYANQISDMGGIPKLIVPKPTAQSAGPTATLENDGFLTLNYSDWNSMTAGKKRENIKNWVSRGATKIRLKDPKGDWIADISLEDGQPTISNAQRLASPKVSPPETTTTPTQTTPQAQPKAQAFVQSLKSKGITSVNQLEPDIIQALKNQGIYDQVKTLLGD